ncbi:hypothetical protein [Chitinimonas lacunae]|uniref:Uncharacterized protein n=1 Tax=Chitinimonas lacunae TaxID=1963018 RepID=A0ABV8MS40_9NEIS
MSEIHDRICFESAFPTCPMSILSPFLLLALVFIAVGFFHWRHRRKPIPVWYRGGLGTAAMLVLLVAPRCVCRLDLLELFLLELSGGTVFYLLVLFGAFLLSLIHSRIAKTLVQRTTHKHGLNGK